MAVIATATRVSYVGNGSTTAFATGFKFYASTDLLVVVTPAVGSPQTKTLGVDYTVTGAAQDAGGTVTFVSAPANNSTVTISRVTATTQGTVLQSNGPFVPLALTDMSDRLTLEEQETQFRTTSLESRVTSAEAEIAAIVAATVTSLSATKSVKDYGAKGDGSTDDTAAIQAAINSFAANPATGTGGVGAHASLLFPAGTYKITSAIEIVGVNNVKIWGLGAKIAYVGDTTPASSPTAVRVEGCSWIEIEGLHIDAGGAMYGLRVSPFDKLSPTNVIPSFSVTLRKLKVENFADHDDAAGIWCGETPGEPEQGTQVSEVTFYDCDVYAPLPATNKVVCLRSNTGGNVKNFRLYGGVLSGGRFGIYGLGDPGTLFCGGVTFLEQNGESAGGHPGEYGAAAFFTAGMATFVACEHESSAPCRFIDSSAGNWINSTCSLNLFGCGSFVVCPDDDVIVNAVGATTMRGCEWINNRDPDVSVAQVQSSSTQADPLEAESMDISGCYFSNADFVPIAGLTLGSVKTSEKNVRAVFNVGGLRAGPRVKLDDVVISAGYLVQNGPAIMADVTAKLLTMTGAMNLKIDATAIDMAVDDSHEVVVVDCTSAGVTVTLPDTTGRRGRPYTFVKSDASGHSMTIAGLGMNRINGGSTYATSTDFGVVRVVSDGVNWWLI